MDRFTISLVERNSIGQPTGRMKTFSSDSSYKIWTFFVKNNRVSKNNSRNSGPYNENFDIDSYASQIRKKKRPSFDDGEKP